MSSEPSKIPERRLRRRRSPPRIISLAGDIGSDSPMKGKKELIRPKLTPINSQKRGIPRPVLINTIRMKPEFRTSLPPSNRTTVLTLPESKTAHRMDVPRVSSRKPSESKILTISNSGSVIKNKSLGGSTVQFSKGSALRKKTTALRGAGLGLSPGETHLWKLTNNGVPKSKKGERVNHPKLLVEGDQGVRVSFMTMMGKILQDIEVPPHHQPIQLPAPSGTRLVAATGLGGSGSIPEHLKTCAGGILTELSTKNRTGVGFEPTSTLIQLGPLTYNCRGAHLQLKTIYPGAARSKKQAFTANEVLDGQSELKLSIPSTIDNLVIIMSGEGEESNPLSVDLGGLQIKSGPTLIKRQNSIAYVWDVVDDVEKVSLVQITAQVSKGWDIQSMVGINGSYENWLSTLTNGSWVGLVEEGPLTPIGSSTLRWINAPIISDSKPSRGDFDSRKMPEKKTRDNVRGSVEVKPISRASTRLAKKSKQGKSSRESDKKARKDSSSRKKRKGR